MDFGRDDVLTLPAGPTLLPHRQLWAHQMYKFLEGFCAHVISPLKRILSPQLLHTTDPVKVSLVMHLLAKVQSPASKS